MFMFHKKKKKKPMQIKMHFLRRCMERIGSPIDSNRLKELMLSNSMEMVCRESNNRTHWLVPKALLPKGYEREIVAVYDGVRHEFVTVLYRYPQSDDFAMEDYDT